MDAFWILALLIAVSGYFALAEMALASARRSKLVPLAESGDRHAALTLAIKEHPSRLLAATQTGVTAAALLSGVFGESAMKDIFAEWTTRWLPFAASIRDEISLTATIVLVTAFSIVFGEIVPKRIAIAHPEKVAMVCAPSMSLFIRTMSPLIHLLSWAADVVLRLLPVKAAPAVVSIEDILAYVDESERAGEIAPEESHLLGNVFRLEDWRVAAIMTPAADVAYIDLLRPHEHNLAVLRESPHSQMPICKGHLQQTIGVLESHDLLQAALAGKIDFAETPKAAPLFIPGSLTLIELLRTFRTQRATFALVVNEFGQTEGIVTLDDLLRSVVGDMMPFSDDPDEALAVRRADGSWLLDGLIPVSEMKEKLELRDIPDEDFGNFHTLGGFVLTALGRIPKKGEFFEYAGWRFEVVDVDQNRVDEVLASPIGEKTNSAA
ncbi:MAG: hemolysin family protein [Propionivibrio sp.]